METHDNNMKRLIGGLMSGDEEQIKSATSQLTESIIVDREMSLIECLLENYKGETDV